MTSNLIAQHAKVSEKVENNYDNDKLGFAYSYHWPSQSSYPSKIWYVEMYTIFQEKKSSR